MIYANVSERSFGKKTENGLTCFLGASLYTIKTNGGKIIKELILSKKIQKF